MNELKELCKGLPILWSGGLDSTVFLFYLLKETEMIIQPYYIVHIKSVGKCGKEWRLVTEKLYPSIIALPKYKNRILKPIKLSFPMNKEMKRFRNSWFLWYLKTIHDVRKVALGLLDSDLEEIVASNFNLDDVNPQQLENWFNLDLLTTSGIGWKNKVDLLCYCKNRLTEQEFSIILQSDSCQLWWKRPCGQCHSCVDRITALLLVFGLVNFDTVREPTRAKSYKKYIERNKKAFLKNKNIMN